jgi:hypothetical protein
VVNVSPNEGPKECALRDPVRLPPRRSRHPLLVFVAVGDGRVIRSAATNESTNYRTDTGCRREACADERLAERNDYYPAIKIASSAKNPRKRPTRRSTNS